MTDENTCTVATEIALEMAMEKCGSKSKMMEEVSALLGLDYKDIDACDIVLEDGLTKDECTDLRKVRQWVMCRAFELLELDETNSFSMAMKMAWKDAKDICADQGVVI